MKQKRESVLSLQNRSLSTIAREYRSNPSEKLAKEYAETAKRKGQIRTDSGVNQYNPNHSHGIAQRGFMIRGIQRVKRKEKSKTGHWVYSLIGHVIGYLKKRK